MNSATDARHGPRRRRVGGRYRHHRVAAARDRPCLRCGHHRVAGVSRGRRRRRESRRRSRAAAGRAFASAPGPRSARTGRDRRRHAAHRGDGGTARRRSKRSPSAATRSRSTRSSAAVARSSSTSRTCRRLRRSSRCSCSRATATCWRRAAPTASIRPTCSSSTSTSGRRATPAASRSIDEALREQRSDLRAGAAALHPQRERREGAVGAWRARSRRSTAVGRGEREAGPGAATRVLVGDARAVRGAGERRLRDMPGPSRRASEAARRPRQPADPQARRRIGRGHRAALHRHAVLRRARRARDAARARRAGALCARRDASRTISRRNATAASTPPRCSPRATRSPRPSPPGRRSSAATSTRSANSRSRLGHRRSRRRPQAPRARAGRAGHRRHRDRPRIRSAPAADGRRARRRHGAAVPRRRARPREVARRRVRRARGAGRRAGRGVGARTRHPSMPVDWLDRMSREAEERLTIAAFVAELQANLRSAEKELDAFFRDPADERRPRRGAEGARAGIRARSRCWATTMRIARRPRARDDRRFQAGNGPADDGRLRAPRAEPRRRRLLRRADQARATSNRTRSRSTRQSGRFSAEWRARRPRRVGDATATRTWPRRRAPVARTARRSVCARARSGRRRLPYSRHRVRRHAGPRHRGDARGRDRAPRGRCRRTTRRALRASPTTPRRARSWSRPSTTSAATRC